MKRRSQHIGGIVTRLLPLTLLLTIIIIYTTTTTSSFTLSIPLPSTNLLLHSPPLHATFLTETTTDSFSSSSASASSCRIISTSHVTNNDKNWKSELSRHFATIALGIALLIAPNMAIAENELSAKYGGSGFDTSLVDQTCLLDHCSLQAKACLHDDSNCRKGLTCTAKCLGDNSCITGCMARYGNVQLDNLLKCTIEDHECIKVAILPGGSDIYGTEPAAPAPTISNFNIQSLQGSWYKVVGYNPNYDCYACQRNTFSSSSSSSSSTVASSTPSSSSTSSSNTLQMDVEFSMPHLLPDGSPLPPSGNVRETLNVLYNDNDIIPMMATTGLKSIALNDYHTNEIMIFDQPNQQDKNPLQQLVFHSGTEQEQSYSRTAHSEGEMFGLKFWENWYIIGENDKDASEEFKFVYYNGKTRQNTYEGAFVYSRTKDLSPDSMKKVYQIAQNAGMDPNQFCRIRNGCFPDENPNLIRKDIDSGWGSPNNPFRGILASTRVSELLGVEPVAARDMLRRNTPTATVLTPESLASASVADAPTATTRHWWYEVGDYLENPHRHYAAMNQLRQPMVWPKDIVESSTSR